jgi:hypothetical protein
MSIVILDITKLIFLLSERGYGRREYGGMIRVTTDRLAREVKIYALTLRGLFL